MTTFTTKTCDTCHTTQEIRDGETTCFRCRTAPPPKTIRESIAETRAAFPVGTRITVTEHASSRGRAKTVSVTGTVVRHNTTTMTVAWDGGRKNGKVTYPAFAETIEIVKADDVVECRCCGNREQDTLKVETTETGKWLVCLKCETARPATEE